MDVGVWNGLHGYAVGVKHQRRRSLGLRTEQLAQRHNGRSCDGSGAP